MADKEASSCKDIENPFFELEAKDVATDCFAAMDFGTSLLKIVYLKKSDQEEKSRLKIYVKKFQLDEIVAMVNFLKEHRPENKDGDQKPVIMVTGVNAGSYLERTRKEVNVRIDGILMEWACTTDALYKLVTTTPKKQLVRPISETVLVEVEGVLNHFQRITREQVGIDFAITEVKSPDFWKRHLPSKDETTKPWSESDPDLFPISLFSLGSTAVHFNIQKDGTASICSFDKCAGRSVLGLGSVLTNAKGYEEILGKAVEGDNTKIDIMTSDGMVASKNPSYQEAMNIKVNNPRAFFGKVMGTKLDDWDSDDIASAFIGLMADNIASFAYTSALIQGSRTIIFAGNTISHSFFQDRVARSFETKKVYYPKNILQHEFLTNGGFLGALGAIMHRSSEQ